jgi:2-methylisocitrate lyase-like PEP mutase family enzyme
MSTQIQKCLEFEALHKRRETFIIPNPWDAGSALLLQEAGFKALATTSSGFAQTLGKVDGEVTLEEKLEHCRLMASVTNIPINADFENGFAHDPAETAENLLKLVKTGVAGASIEDYSRSEIYDFNLAVERVAACVEAVAQLPFPFLLTARAEGLLRQACTLDEAITRLQAFEKAGADVLYAPALKTLEEVETVLGAVSKPVNVLASFMPTIALADYARLGVSRVSIGGALAGRIRQATEVAAKRMFESGRFD